VNIYALELHKFTGSKSDPEKRRMLVRADAILSVSAMPEGSRILIEGGFGEAVEEPYDKVVAMLEEAGTKARPEEIEDVSSSG